MLRINKTALDALNCDGRYLDLRAQPFAWSVRLLAGKLAHRAIELDHAGGFQRPVGDVVTHAWMETATDRGSAARFAAELAGSSTVASADAGRSSSSIMCCRPTLRARILPARIQRRTVSGSRPTRLATSITVNIAAYYYTSVRRRTSATPLLLSQ